MWEPGQGGGAPVHVSSSFTGNYSSWTPLLKTSSDSGSFAIPKVAYIIASMKNSIFVVGLNVMFRNGHGLEN